ncbi:hypothetical protein GIB67_002152 [Kingdonia uniflora]|uniref:Protein kinase domain-containing protein n=1 Tax=Kingdonia uniflora TaxID=39325 RepID=A0A7J7KWL2_9MAGN|nr:hypothetical protein GIB67_002152 [Kingdonia uniflora]
MIEGVQDALLDKKCPEVMEWKKRFSIVVDIAKGLEFLHYVGDPRAIHGDIKLSNILLDTQFNSKIIDFGLASRIEEICDAMSVIQIELEERKLGNSIGSGSKVRMGSVKGEDNGSIIEETESVVMGFEELVIGCGVDVSPESCVRVVEVEASSKTDNVTVEASSSEVLDKTSVSEGNFDKSSVDSRMNLVCRRSGQKKSISGRDWWWRHDNGVVSETGVGEETTSISSKPSGIKSEQKEKTGYTGGHYWTKIELVGRRRVVYALVLIPRESGGERNFVELSKKKKKSEKTSSGVSDRKKKRKSNGSVDWWLDGLSGEFCSGRRNNQDWASGEIHKSGGASNTASMRGTVCYIAPEYGGGGQLSENYDVYSYGVLLLVLISGRRPLQVTASPMSEFEQANLISWAKHLACRVVFLCLQRSPIKRPSIKEVVGMLSGDSKLPHLPVDFSLSPPSNLFKFRKKARGLMSRGLEPPTPTKESHTAELIESAVTGTLNVLKACSETSGKKVVVVSSVANVLMNPNWPRDRVKDEAWNGKVGHVNQANNMYLFPGIGLGTLLSGAHYISYGMYSAYYKGSWGNYFITCDPYSLASYMTDEEINKGILFPSISSIQHITMEVSAAALHEGVVEELAEEHGDIETKELMHMSEEETKEYVARSM